MPPRSPIKGDHSKRVTVPLPQSLNDLEHISKSHFGSKGGRLKMYHKEVEIQKPQQFRDIVDNDVVIVRRESAEPMAMYPSNMTTTHQSAYVKHPIEQRRPPSRSAQPGPPAMKPPTFQGRSCYNGDYIEHPIDSQEHQKKPPKEAWEPNTLPLTSRTTYAENFPWHANSPPAKSKAPKSGNPAYNNSPPAFQGMSSYKLDYIKHQQQRPQSAGGQRPRRTEKRVDPGTIPFNGTTTYNVDYKEHANAQTKRIPPWNQEVGNTYKSPPFIGHSEYKQEYIKKERARPALVHIEPEEKHRSPL